MGPALETLPGQPSISVLETDTLLPPGIRYSIFEIEENSPAIRKYDQGIDLVRPDTPNYRSNGFVYEQKGFAETVKQLGEDQFAFGPGVVDAAFSRIGIARPDALIFTIDGQQIRLDSMVEYKVSHLQTSRKLRGFEEFTDYMRRETEEFKNFMGEAIGGLLLVGITVPEDRKIMVEFVSPHFGKDGTFSINGSLFPVSYSIVKPKGSEQQVA